MKKLLLLLSVILTMSVYTFADQLVLSGGTIPLESESNFSGNTTDGGIKGFGTIEIKTPMTVKSNGNEYGVYVNETNKKLTIIGNVDPTKIEINNNTSGGIYAVLGSTVEISKTNLTLMDNGGKFLQNVVLNDNVVTMGYSNNDRLNNFLDVVDNVTGSGNELTITGFNEGINLGSTLVQNAFFNKDLTANNSNFGFIIKNNTEIESQIINASSNTIGFMIQNSTTSITAGAITISNSSSDGLQIKNSSVTTKDSASILLKDNAGYGINIENSQYYDFAKTAGTTIKIDVNKKGKGFRASHSIIEFDQTRLEVLNSTGVGLLLENSSVMTMTGRQLILKGAEEEEELNGYGVYVEAGSRLRIENVRVEEAITLSNNKYGIYGEDGATIELVNNYIYLDNNELALRNVTLISNTIVADQRTSSKYRTGNFTTNLIDQKSTGSGNNLTVRGFEEGIDFSYEKMGNLFNGGFLVSDDNSLGLKIENLSGYNLTGIDVTASSNTVGFIIENSTATISLYGDLKISYSGRSSTDSSKTENEVGGLRIKNSYLTLDSEIELISNKGYGLEISTSSINMTGGINLEGNQDGKGIIVKNSTINTTGSIKIKETKGTALEISKSTYTIEGAEIQISSATEGFLIENNSKVNFYRGYDDTKMMININNIQNSAITVAEGSNLKITNTIIEISTANKGIIGEQKNNVEIISSSLTFNNINGKILDNVTLIKSTLTVVGLGKDVEEKDGNKNYFSNKANITGGNGNRLKIEEFYNGLELNEDNQQLFNAGIIEAYNNNKAIKMENLQGITLTGGTIAVSSNTVAIEIKSSSVSLNNIKFRNPIEEHEKLGIYYNEVGLKVEGSSVTGTNLITNNNKVGIEITGSESKLNFDVITANQNDIGIKVSSGGKFLIRETPINLQANNFVAIQAEGSGSKITIDNNLTINDGGSTSEVIFKAVQGGSIEFVNKRGIFGRASEIAVYSIGKDVSGNNAEIKFNNEIMESGSSGDKITSVGFLAEDGGQITAGIITANSNIESGIEIRGGANHEDSKIIFNTLTANNNKYGIKVSSKANYALSNDNESINMILQGNTEAAIGIINSTMTIKNLGTIDTEIYDEGDVKNKIGAIIKENAYLEVKDGTFSLNGNLINGMEIVENSKAKIDGKLETNNNGENGIVFEENSELIANEIETSKNDRGSGILIKNNNTVQLTFNKLIANGNLYGIDVVKSSWTLNGQNVEFENNTNAINVKGSTVSFVNITSVTSSNNNIFLSVDNFYYYEGAVLKEIYTSNVLGKTDLEIKSSKEAGIKVIGCKKDSKEYVSTINFKDNLNNITSTENGYNESGEQIQEGKGDGIIIGSYGKLTANTITVTGNSNAGLKIEGEGAIVDFNNLISKNNKYGIEIKDITGGSIALSGEMKIEDNTEAGVYVNNVESTTLSKQLEIGNNGTGLLIEGRCLETGEMEGSYLKAEKGIKISSNSKVGVKIATNSVLEVLGDSILEENLIGIQVEYSTLTVAGNIEVKNNKVFSEEESKGILITSGTLSVVDGNIKSNNNGQYGFEIINSTVTSSGMIESVNNSIGLKVENSKVITKGLNISSNTRYGINVGISEKIEIEFNGNNTEFNMVNNSTGIYVLGGKIKIVGGIDKMDSSGNNNVAEIVAGGMLEIEGSGFKASGSLDTGLVRSGNGVYIAGYNSLNEEEKSTLKVTGEMQANNNQQNGIKVETEGIVDIEKLIAKKNTKAGISANSNSKVTLKEIEVEGGEYGIFATGNSIITITSSVTITGSETGIYANEGTVDLSTGNVEISLSTTAIILKGYKNINASKATLKISSNTTGLQIEEEGSIEISSATIEGNTVGLSVSGSGSIEGGSISFNENETAIMATNGNEFTIENAIEKLSLTGNTVGLLASESGKIILNTEINTEGNDTLIKAEDNGVVEIFDNMEITGNKVAINAVSGGSITGKNIKIKNNDVGIKAEQDGEINFTGTLEVTDSTTGIKMLGGQINAGSMKIKNNTTGIEITGGENNLAKAEIEGNATGIKLVGGNLNITETTTIKGNTVTAIELEDNGKLSAASLTLTDNARGILVSGSEGTIEIGNLKLGTERIEIEGGTLTVNNTTISKTNGAIFATSGDNSINLTGSKIMGVETLIEATSGKNNLSLTGSTIAVGKIIEATDKTEITGNNSQIISKIKDDAKQIALNLTNNSSWQLTSLSTLNQLQINNSTVKIGTNTLTVNKLENTEGTGIIEIAVDLDLENNDRLIIEENGQISGKYKLKLTKAKDVKKEDLKDNIRIIQNNVEDTPSNTFSLEKNKVNINGYIYKLYQGSQLNIENVSKYNGLENLSFANDSGIDEDSWYLVNSKEIAEYIKGIARSGELMTFVAKSGMNTMNKRIGDIRRTPEDSYSGVWARTFGKNYDVSEGIKSSMTLFGLEGGYDMRISKNSQDRYYIGAMVGYQSVGSINIKQEEEQKDATGDGSAPSFGLYGTWIGQNGWYVDIAARYIMVGINMTSYSNGDKIEYKPKSNYIGFSGEVGKEIGVNIVDDIQIMLEPKLEISMVKGSSSKTEASDGNEIEFDGGNSINGKIGISAGYQIELDNDKELTPFIELAYNKEFDGKTNITYMGEKYNSDLSGGGIEATIGLNGYLNNGISVYGLLSYENESKQSNFGWNLGVRYGFGGEKALSNNNTKEKEKAKSKTKEKTKAKEKELKIQKVDKLIETVDTRMLQRIVVVKNQAIEKTEDGQVSKVEITNDADDKYVKQNEITSGQMTYLKDLAAELSMDNIEKIIIASHVSDNTGDEAVNRRTSIEKAKKVKAIFIRAGIESENIEIRGYGSKKQVADNSTKEGRNKNNRIEIFIKR